MQKVSKNVVKTINPHISLVPRDPPSGESLLTTQGEKLNENKKNLKKKQKQQTKVSNLPRKGGR
jgi:hypothetical protein